LRRAWRRRRARRSAVAAARAAAEAARAAAEAARALEALNAELHEATRMAIGNDYANWHPDGFGDVFVGLASRIAADALRVAGVAEGVATTPRASRRARRPWPRMNSLFAPWCCLGVDVLISQVR
jgi:hypothetical protein